MTNKILVLIAAGTLFACAGEETSAPQTAAAMPQQSQSQQRSAPPAAGSAERTPAPEPQRMTQEQRQAAIANRRFQENQHYTRLTPEQPTFETEGDLVEVVEVFQYSCPACNSFEPYLNAWHENKADYVNFVRVPAPWGPLGELHARGYYAAEALGIVEQSHPAFFDEFHINRNYMQSANDVASFYSQFGVDEETFVATMNSFAVHTKIQRANDLIERYNVTGTPGIVIDGKYTATGTQAQSYENWFAIIDELAAVEWAAASD